MLPPSALRVPLITPSSLSEQTAAKVRASSVFFETDFFLVTRAPGSDRTSLNVDSDGDDLIAAVAAAQKNTIVFVATPGAVLTNWDVAAIVTNFMPGQEAGNAIADILFGDVNPSLLRFCSFFSCIETNVGSGGKLPITFPNIDNEEQMTQLQWPG
jgi:beta-glucosidase